MKKPMQLITVMLGSAILLSFPFSAAAASIDMQPNNNSDNAIDTRVPEDEIAYLEKELNTVSTLKGYENSYEPNNTMNTAYPYESMIKYECKGDNEDWLGHYNCFYSPNWLTSDDDIDYFKIKLQKGKYYVAVLKNVWVNQIRDLRLYYQKSDGSWWYLHPKQKVDGQSLFHFTAECDTYYIQISGATAPGYNDGEGVNWLAVEKDGTIDERLSPYDKNPDHAFQ